MQLRRAGDKADVGFLSCATNAAKIRKAHWRASLPCSVAGKGVVDVIVSALEYGTVRGQYVRDIHKYFVPVAASSKLPG